MLLLLIFGKHDTRRLADSVEARSRCYDDENKLILLYYFVSSSIEVSTDEHVVPLAVAVVVVAARNCGVSSPPHFRITFSSNLVFRAVLRLITFFG